MAFSIKLCEQFISAQNGLLHPIEMHLLPFSVIICKVNGWCLILKMFCVLYRILEIPFVSYSHILEENTVLSFPIVEFFAEIVSPLPDMPIF